MVKGRGRLFRIVGVPGCGKTTLTILLTKLFQEADGLFAYMDTKHIQCQLARVENEKQYREIPEEKRRELFPFLVSQITKITDLHPERVCFFERHLCSMNEEGVIISRGVPDEHGERMVGQAIILAHGWQIAFWREVDKKVRHDRHLLTPNQIAKEQIQEIELALEAGWRWDFPVRLFFNRQGCSEKVAAEIFAFLKSCRVIRRAP